jgi:adenosylcobyric acid synthase
MARSILVVGTTSHAGKSLITAAICRILARQGHRVTPFKGQNMALNAYITEDGKEIGHAQAVQAWAAGIEPRVEMNPILLKPQGDMTSQVILMGEVAGITQAADYYRDYFDRGWEAITNCLDRLRSEYDYIVCEGAGSPAEINLKHRDLTNMRVASYLGANTVLVADIDRGGVFAHIVGTLELLEPEERALIKGIIINKFRGQKSLLDSGIEWLEDRVKIPVLGVVPWLDRLFPAEDSLDLLERRSRKPNAEVNIGVIKLPRIANFTDFEPLDAEPSVNLNYITHPHQIDNHQVIILPGSKTTIADLEWMKSIGMVEKILDYRDRGGIIMGICGGWQMLGETLIDPQGIEGLKGSYSGLGLLPTETIIDVQKTRTQRELISDYPRSGLALSGYEIHQGITTMSSIDSTEYKYLTNDPNMGIVDRNLQIWGTYLHGIFDRGEWRRTWLNQVRAYYHLPPLNTEVPDYHHLRQQMFDRLADDISQYVDLMPLLTAESSVNKC